MGDSIRAIHWFRLGRQPIIGIRFGLGRRSFSERYQGTRGIPVRFFHFFGGRFTFVLSRIIFNRQEQGNG